MKKTLLAIGLVLAGLQAAAAQPAPAPVGAPSNCYAAKLRNSSGVFLSLTTGLRFQVLPGGGRTAVTTWAPLDKLQVCRSNGSLYEITNLSQPHPSSVKAMRAY